MARKSYPEVPPAEAFAVRPSTIPGAGLGLFALRAFDGDALVGRYAGELITFEELAAGRFAGSDYLLAVSSNHLIVGEGPNANHTRYINHCAEAPNLLLEVSARWKSAWFLATRPIAAGEELFFDYGEAYWKEAATVASRPDRPS